MTDNQTTQLSVMKNQGSHHKTSSVLEPYCYCTEGTMIWCCVLSPCCRSAVLSSAAPLAVAESGEP